MNLKATLTLVAIISLTLSTAALGQLGTDPPAQDKEVEIELLPTRFGQQFDFAGAAVKKVQNRIETFGVRAVADLPDGAILEVMIVTEKGEQSVGTIELFLGSGMLELVSSDDPSPAFPVSSIQGALVTYRGDTVLSGQFPG